MPNDSVQGPTVASYIINKLKAKRVYIIDDQETYSQGLADGVQNILKAQGRHSYPRLGQPDGERLLVDDREDPEQHPGRLHPVAACPAGSGASVSS